MVKARVAGLAALASDFALLSKAESRTVLKKAVRGGAKVVQAAVRSRAPVDSGVLKRNIVVAMHRSDSPDTQQTAVVKLRAGKKTKYANNVKNKRRGRARSTYVPDGPAFYGPMVEEGTEKMVAKPYMRPGFDASSDAAADVVELGAGAAIDQILAGKR